MRLLIMTLIGLAIGGGMFYYISKNQMNTQSQAQEQQESAQKAADAYRKNQQDMMKQLEQ